MATTTTTAHTRKTAAKTTANTTTSKPAVKTEAKPAAQPEPTDAAPGTNGTAISERARKAQQTRAESAASDEKRVCAGACGKELRISAFPTTTRDKDGVMGRGTECRTCRNKRRADNKAA